MFLPGQLATETNTSRPLPSPLDAFVDRGYYPAGTHPPEMTVFSGPLWAARQRGRERGWAVIEGHGRRRAAGRHHHAPCL
ncbi:hypothetical protein ACU4GD_22640 [Cupriavidus basilensis]